MDNAKSFEIQFADRQTARVAHVQNNNNLRAALVEFGIDRPRPTIVLVGGATGLSKSLSGEMHHLFVDVLAPLAQALGAYVVDGATDSGVIRMMGSARGETGATFPLIGVAATGTVVLPGAARSGQKTFPLEPHHSHFLLVPGSNWGDETPWIAEVASLLAQGQPSVTVLVNGGMITREDAAESIHHGRPVIVVAGSGRTADHLAAALRGEPPDQPTKDMIATGLLSAIELSASSEKLSKAIRKILLKK